MPPAIAPALLVGGGIAAGSGLISRALGPSGAERRAGEFVPVGFNTPGLNADVSRSSVGITRSSGLQENLDTLRRTLNNRASAFAGLRSRVSGAVGEVTQSRVDAIRSAGLRTVGNLREELARRRVGGSSFAQREIASTEAMFGREEERAAAEGKLTELGLTAEFLNEEFASSIQAVTSLVDQFNFESDLAARIGGAASAAINSANVAAAELSAQRRQGAGELFGTLLGLII